MNGIKAIETQYKGYRFRSRLEARWAVFFDALGIEWQYEPEGFELANGDRYLPDFYLPVHNQPRFGETGRYIEIKGEFPDLEYCEMLIRFSKSVCRCVHIFVGDPGDFQEFVAHPAGGGSWVNKERFEFAPDCDPNFKAWLQDLERDYDAYMRQPGMGAWSFVNRDGNYEVATCLRAVQAARSARFEHGENGAPGTVPQKEDRIERRPLRTILANRCPKCRGASLEYFTDQSSATFDYWVHCPVCDLSGPHDDSYKGAILEWNRLAL